MSLLDAARKVPLSWSKREYAHSNDEIILIKEWLDGKLTNKQVYTVLKMPQGSFLNWMMHKLRSLQRSGRIKITIK